TSAGAPRITIRLKPEAMTQMGFRPVEVLEMIETAYRGTIVAQIHRDNQAADLAGVLQPADRQDPELVSSLLVKNSSGKMIPLHEIADVYLTNGRFSILHEGARRRQTVTCRTSGRDVSSFVKDARKAVATKINLSGGVYATFSGAAQAKEQA